MVFLSPFEANSGDSIPITARSFSFKSFTIRCSPIATRFYTVGGTGNIVKLTTKYEKQKRRPDNLIFRFY
jgi:hypothetical protein